MDIVVGFEDVFPEAVPARLTFLHKFFVFLLTAVFRVLMVCFVIRIVSRRATVIDKYG